MRELEFVSVCSVCFEVGGEVGSSCSKVDELFFIQA